MLVSAAPPPNHDDLQKNNTDKISLAFDEIPSRPRKHWQNAVLMAKSRADQLIFHWKFDFH
jgi:hypothetical protein